VPIDLVAVVVVVVVVVVVIVISVETTGAEVVRYDDVGYGITRQESEKTRQETLPIDMTVVRRPATYKTN
jgi:predicted DNA repair protein MutK